MSSRFYQFQLEGKVLDSKKLNDVFSARLMQLDDGTTVELVEPLEKDGSYIEYPPETRVRAAYREVILSGHGALPYFEFQAAA